MTGVHREKISGRHQLFRNAFLQTVALNFLIVGYNCNIFCAFKILLFKIQLIVHFYIQ